MPVSVLSTSRLLTLIRGARTFEEATAYHQANPGPTFKDTLFSQMQEKNLTPKDMIRLTGIDRSYFYHVLSGQKCPGRNMVLRIGLCLRLSLHDMNHLLVLAGASTLYAKIRRDALLIFGIQQKYSMEKTNEMLCEAGEEPLYWTEKK